MTVMILISFALLALVCQAELDGPGWWPLTFNSVPFRPPRFVIRKASESPVQGLLFLGPKNNLMEGILPDVGSTPVIYDQNGQLVWKGPDVQTSNFRVQMLFGAPVITYWSGIVFNGYGYGAVHILDQTYKEIHKVTLKGHFITAIGNFTDIIESYIDLHESRITSRNTMLVTAYNLTQIDIPSTNTSQTWVIKPSFYEIDVQTNKVLFSWSPLDHQDIIPVTSSHSPTSNDPRPQERPWDIYHMNSVDDAASGYLVSLRHTFSAVYVNWDGSIKWYLNGENGHDFDLCHTCKFSWQHDIRVFDETADSMTLTIFNNDDKNGPPSAGLILGVNLNTMTVVERRTLIDFSDYIKATTQGNLQTLEGNTSGNFLVGYGSYATIKEFNAQGDVVWTGQFGPSCQIASYRSFKFDWHAIPGYKPAIQSTAYQTSSSNMSTHMYVSWNGATDIEKWNIYAESGNASDSQPVLITSVPKVGFETPIIIPGYLDAVSVEGVHTNGTVLPRSSMKKTELHRDPNDITQPSPTPDDPAHVATAIAAAALMEEQVVGVLPDPQVEGNHAMSDGLINDDGEDAETSDTASPTAPLNVELGLIVSIIILVIASICVLLWVSLKPGKRGNQVAHKYEICEDKE